MKYETSKQRRVDGVSAHVAPGVSVSRRRVMNMIVKSAVAASIVPSIANATGANDPTYEAIEAHRSAYAAHGSAIDNWNVTGPRQQKKAQKIADEAGDRECRMLVALLTTVPATAAGLSALIEYIRECQAEGQDILGSVLNPKFDSSGAGNPLDASEVLLATIGKAVHAMAH
jgi:hypothetical protein